MLRHKTRLSLPAAGLSGFEPPMSPEELAIRDSVHQHHLANDGLRPTGTEPDRMSEDEAASPGSAYYDVFGAVGTSREHSTEQSYREPVQPGSRAARTTF